MTLQQNRATQSPARWDDVQIGDRVQLRRNGREYLGKVDNRTADGTVVWVMPDGGNRQLFHVSDGYHLTAADSEGTHHEDN